MLGELASALASAFGGRVTVCLNDKCFPRQYGKGVKGKKAVKYGKKSYYANVPKSAKRVARGRALAAKYPGQQGKFAAAAKKCGGKGLKMTAFRACVKKTLKGK